MRDNSAIVDATLQAADDIQTNVQTYITDKINPAPTVESGLRKGLLLGMLATETRIEGEDKGSEPSSPGSPGQIKLPDFGELDATCSEDVTMISPDVNVTSNDVDDGISVEVSNPDPEESAEMEHS